MNKLRPKQEEAAPKGGAATAKPAGKASQARLPRGLISVLNGTFLTRENVLGNMPFILFCAGLMVLYIGYGYHTERIVRELHNTNVQVKEQRSEYITVRARLEQEERQSHVARGIKELGLEESRVPPVKIPVTRKEMKTAGMP